MHCLCRDLHYLTLNINKTCGSHHVMQFKQLTAGPNLSCPCTSFVELRSGLKAFAVDELCGLIDCSVQCLDTNAVYW